MKSIKRNQIKFLLRLILAVPAIVIVGCGGAAKAPSFEVASCGDPRTGGLTQVANPGRCCSGKELIIENGKPLSGCGETTSEDRRDALTMSLRNSNGATRMLGRVEERNDTTRKKGDKVNGVAGKLAAKDLKAPFKPSPQSIVKGEPGPLGAVNENLESSEGTQKGSEKGSIPGLNPIAKIDSATTSAKDQKDASEKSGSNATGEDEGAYTAGQAAASAGGPFNREGSVNNPLAQLFGSGSGSAPVGKMEFGSEGSMLGALDRSPSSVDPEDYFNRINLHLNIFKVVELRYRKESARRALEKARGL